MKNILLLVSLIFLIQSASAGRLQNVDFMTEAELITAGATKTSLLNDDKIYIDSVAKTLDQAILDGDIGGGTSPTTTEGDLIVRGSSVDEALAASSNVGYVLTSTGAGSIPSYQILPSATASFTTVTKTSTSTLLTIGEDNVVVDASSADFTITLPSAVSNNGLTYKITKSTAANIVTIDADGTETIGGELVRALYDINDSVIISSDGSNWGVYAREIKKSCQTRFLSANSTSIGVVADLTFSNLVIGLGYELISQTNNSNFGNGATTLKNGATTLGTMYGASENLSHISTGMFIAAATTATLTQNSTIQLLGDGSKTGTWLTLCESGDMIVETTRF